MRRSWLRCGTLLVGLAVCAGPRSAAAQGPGRVYPPPPPPGPWVGGGHRPMVMPGPLGAYVRAWEAVQRAGAEEDRFVVYLSEWLDGALPGPYGRHHLDQIARRLPHVPYPVVIQTCDQGGPLDQQRRLAVVAFLAGHGVADADARVRIGRPRAEGLYGDEAPRVFLPIVGGAGAAGGFGGTGSLGGGLGGLGGLGGFGGGGGLGLGGLGSFGGGRGY